MPDGRAPQATSAAFDPILLAVLSNRFESIIREMTNTVMKASRSSVIKNARDMSCGILTYDHRLISVEEALPIHVTALELTTKPITELFDDIKQGDAFLNNSPFYGGTHHADLTLCVPVFCDGEPMLWTLARSHHADIGAPEPTTYLPYAKTISCGDPERNANYKVAIYGHKKCDAAESHACARFALTEKPAAMLAVSADMHLLAAIAGRLESQTRQCTRYINQLVRRCRPPANRGSIQDSFGHNPLEEHTRSPGNRRTAPSVR